MDLKQIAILLKQYQARGNGYVGQMLLITANAKLFENYLAMYGITVLEGILIGFMFTVLLGWLDFHYGIWKRENDYSWSITPMANETIVKIRFIEKILKEKLP